MIEGNLRKCRGILRLQNKKPKEARRCFGRAMICYREAGNQIGEATAFAGLGNTYSRSGQLARTSKCFLRALRCLESDPANTRRAQMVLHRRLATIKDKIDLSTRPERDKHGHISLEQRRRRRLSVDRAKVNEHYLAARKLQSQINRIPGGTIPQRWGGDLLTLLVFLPSRSAQGAPTGSSMALSVVRKSALSASMGAPSAAAAQAHDSRERRLAAERRHVYARELRQRMRQQPRKTTRPASKESGGLSAKAPAGAVHDRRSGQPASGQNHTLAKEQARIKSEQGPEPG